MPDRPERVRPRSADPASVSAVRPAPAPAHIPPAAARHRAGLLLGLQRSAGNNAVAALLAGRDESGATARRPGPEVSAVPGRGPGGPLADGVTAGHAGAARDGSGAETGRVTTVQRAGADMSATLQGRAEQQIAAAKAARSHENGEAGEPDTPAEPPSPEQVAAEKAKQKRAMSGAVVPDDTSGAASAAGAAAGNAEAEAARPAEPVAAAAGGRAAPAPASGGTPDAAEVAAAGQLAAQAARAAQAEAPPEPAVPVAAPPPLTTVDGGGREIPADPVLEGASASVAARIQVLRAGAHQVRTAAAAERAQGHRMEAMLQAGRAAVADSDAGVAALKQHSAHRRSAVAQARSALSVSKDKAAAVAAGAPQVTAKSQEGAQKSGPMAAGSRQLAAQNAEHSPDDAEAAGKSAEQGGKLTRVGQDMGSIDDTIARTKARAGRLAEEAAAAAASNTATEGRIGETEAAIAQSEAKAAAMAGQNAAAKSRLDGFAAEPAAHCASADALDAQGTALHTASVAMEARLAAAQEAYVGGMSAMPPPVPAPDAGVPVQRAAYEGRTRYDPSGAVARALPPWLTGEDPPNAAAAAAHRAREEQRRADEIAEIERECGGHFEQLTASQRAGAALRLTGRHLLTGIGDTDFAKFGLGLLRGFVDPRASLMGIVDGFGQIASGVADLFSAEQWSKDPLGNALKSSADIATGVTVVLGSIAGLAVAIGVILTAIAIVGSIFSFGAVGVALAPIILFCGTVASTVGPWALWAAGVALVLHGLVFIKNLIDASTASTATQLQQSSDKMTEDAQNAGAMALQIGMAKAMEFGGKLLAGRGGGGGGGGPIGEGGVPAGEGAPVGEGTAPTSEAPAPESAGPASEAAAPAAEGGPSPTAAGSAPVEIGEVPAEIADVTPANDNAAPGTEPEQQALKATGTDGAAPAGQPALTVIEGGASAADAPRAMAGGEGGPPPFPGVEQTAPGGTGPLAGTGPVPETVGAPAAEEQAPASEGPAPSAEEQAPTEEEPAPAEEGPAEMDQVPPEIAEGTPANDNAQPAPAWPPQAPTGRKPKIGAPGAAEWRYAKYLAGKAAEGKGPSDVMPFDQWKQLRYDPVLRGHRPGRSGGAQQVAMKQELTAQEGVQQVENVNLGGKFPDGIRPNAAGGTDYFEVGGMTKGGLPEWRERGKLQIEIDALGPNDTMTFVDKTDRANRISYRRGDRVE